jgi:hypothetical protein
MVGIIRLCTACGLIVKCNLLISSVALNQILNNAAHTIEDQRSCPNYSAIALGDLCGGPHARPGISRALPGPCRHDARHRGGRLHDVDRGGGDR